MSRKFDLVLLLPILLLSLLGSLNMFGIKRELFLSHTIFLLVGVIIFYLISHVRTVVMYTHTKLIYISSLLLFFLVFLIGTQVRGATRWLDLYFFRFQPSELFKPLFLILISHQLAQSDERNLNWLVANSIYLGLPILFILLQPDLGNALLYMATFWLLLFFTGVPRKYFMSTFTIGIVLLPLIAQGLKDYQKARLFSFINPEIDPLGLSYNLTQSAISIGSGGFFGKGLGLGTQSRFQFLPEFHTDFAFASFVEQFGFLGGLVVISLFMLIIYRLFIKFSLVKGELKKRIYLLGVIIFFFITVFVNIGMNLGILPVTGIALPFISYGGSSTLSIYIMLGIASAL